MPTSAPSGAVRGLIDEALASNADVVVARRNRPGGDLGDFSGLRVAVSRGSGILAKLLFPRHLRFVSDPMSGIFLVRRTAIDMAATKGLPDPS
jgi:dolichol-phosphate mannosyltransferase